MNLFEVYKLWDIEPVRGLDTTLWDKNGEEYTDLYGGHAVISVGHCHPHYVNALTEQLGKLGFYSNAVQNSLQKTLADKLGKISGYDDYSLFLCNSGAEANENALKLASFHTGKAKVLAFGKAFHGRTSGAVAATDNPKIQSPFNATDHVTFVPLNDIEAVEKALDTGEFAAVIIEGIQGVAGIYEPGDDFLKELRRLCDRTGTVLILDEIQSGYGRTGMFFAHQHAGIRGDPVDKMHIDNEASLDLQEIIPQIPRKRPGWDGGVEHPSRRMDIGKYGDIPALPYLRQNGQALRHAHTAESGARVPAVKSGTFTVFLASAQT